jgi:hypothetical protein
MITGKVVKQMKQLDHDLHLSYTQMFAHVAAPTSKGDEKHKSQRFIEDSPFK